MATAGSPGGGNPTLDALMAAIREDKEMYFFYGSLMDAGILQRVTGLREKPTLTPARIEGYRIKMWVQYPALLDGDPGSMVHGMACVVEGAQAKDRLEQYETVNYKKVWCTIQMGNGTYVSGTTFMWAGDKSDLKEGTFDLKDWQMEHVLDGL
ncbi:Uu.00g024010.m01.CDS01 [Anthostomella pinea]|uniref:Putative gamma-glutamylcyclotransferase n=1 Tax=Anthostomella pinea TaxID=933095 RepID=A0AAI8YP04_9PEZI|nr:Uu.00g024010.m01.CDS01 [Anthostomella pinea]